MYSRLPCDRHGQDKVAAIMTFPIFAAAALVVVLGLGGGVAAQTAAEKEIAARYAPVIHQALGGEPSGDYITNFDFDGDWNGENNWKNSKDAKYRLDGYLYYAVSETETH